MAAPIKLDDVGSSSEGARTPTYEDSASMSSSAPKPCTASGPKAPRRRRGKAAPTVNTFKVEGYDSDGNLVSFTALSVYRIQDLLKHPPMLVPLRHPKKMHEPSDFLTVYGDPNAVTSHPGRPPVGVKGHWRCSCSNVNYPKRVLCNICNVPRSAEATATVAQFTASLHDQWQKFYNGISPYRGEVGASVSLEEMEEPTEISSPCQREAQEERQNANESTITPSNHSLQFEHRAETPQHLPQPPAVTQPTPAYPLHGAYGGAPVAAGEHGLIGQLTAPQLVAAPHFILADGRYLWPFPAASHTREVARW